MVKELGNSFIDETEETGRIIYEKLLEAWVAFARRDVRLNFSLFIKT
ncbi:hypothetical protein ACYULU_10550 [Breznakiellaceae bacterium SP9]